MSEETGILRLSVMLKHRKARLDSFYNVSPDDQKNIIAKFREEYPYLKDVPIEAEFCYRVKSTF
jgi:hypothetical protein